MQLVIEGISVEATSEQSLNHIVSELGLNGSKFSERPIAAKIAGEIFNLNYVPVRSKDIYNDRISIRRAMAASNGVVQLIRYGDPAGKAVYTRTAQFVIFLALHRLYPGIRAKMDCTVGNAVFVEVLSSEFSVDALCSEIKKLVAMDIPLHRTRISREVAVDHFNDSMRYDAAELLGIRTEDYFDIYEYDGFKDYYYGELAPSTGCLQVWDILPAEGGFLFLFPDDNTPDDVAQYVEMPKFMRVCAEGERWCELMGCENVADLNAYVKNGRIRELIRVNEALHEKRYSQLADTILERGTCVVLLSGPSSSGKTTSANRLAIQLRVHGKEPVLISLDDYYLDRDQIIPGPDGTIDFEHINTIDTKLFQKHLVELVSGSSVALPSFNFKSGKREWHDERMQLHDNSVIIVEGLHALNPVLLPSEISSDLIFRVYVSPLIPLNLDDHNRIPTSFVRLLRRIVRDYKTRGASVQQTMGMWESVQRGEKRWIFPYQENADFIFNSSTIYEPVVLKRHIFPLLKAIEPEDSCYEEIRGLVKILNYILPADVDDEIPPTSIVREFIGGNTFYK